MAVTMQTSIPTSTTPRLAPLIALAPGSECRISLHHAVSPGLELTVPIVDYPLEPLVNGDPDRIRMCVLLRNASDLDDV